MCYACPVHALRMSYRFIKILVQKTTMHYSYATLHYLFDMVLNAASIVNIILDDYGFSGTRSTGMMLLKLVKD